MARITDTKMQVELNPQDRRIIRDLTKAIDRLTRNIRPYEVRGAVRRLAEPHTPGQEAPVTPDQAAHRYFEGMDSGEDLEPGEAQMRAGCDTM